MGLFKSRWEKTYQALKDAASACAQEAETKFKQIIFAYEKGRINKDPYISAFRKLHISIFGHDVDWATGYDANDPLAFLMQIRDPFSGFSQACIYYLYLNLMFNLIKKENIKQLSRENLEELQRDLSGKDMIANLYPQRVIFKDKVDDYIADRFKDSRPWAYFPCPTEIIEDKLNLIEGD